MRKSWCYLPRRRLGDFFGGGGAGASLAAAHLDGVPGGFSFGDHLERVPAGFSFGVQRDGVPVGRVEVDHWMLGRSA